MCVCLFFPLGDGLAMCTLAKCRPADGCTSFYKLTLRIYEGWGDMRCASGVSINGRTNVCTWHFQNVQPTKSNSPQIFENKVKENLYNPAVCRQSETRWRQGGLAFRGRVLAQERGDGAGFGDFLGQRALHVFDGWIGSSVQQELHDVGKLARWCCQKTHKRGRTAKFR